MSVLARIFRGEHRELSAPESFIEMASEDGAYRIRRVPDTSMNAIAARWNAGMIYGQENLPANFGTRRVIEVPDPRNPGQWTPVTGSNHSVPDFQTQMAALAGYQESGVIGPQAPNPEGSLSINNMTADAGSPGATLTDGTPTGLPIDEAAPAQGGLGQPLSLGAMYNNFVGGMRNAMFPSGSPNIMELSEFIMDNPYMVGAQTPGGASFIINEAIDGVTGANQQPATTPLQSAAQTAELSQQTQDFLASEDAVIAAEQGNNAAAPSIDREMERVISAINDLRALADRMARRNRTLETGVGTQ